MAVGKLDGNSLGRKLCGIVAGLLFARSTCSVVGSPILSFVPLRTHARNGGERMSCKTPRNDPFSAKYN